MFKDKPVEREKLEPIVEAICLAPMGFPPHKVEVTVIPVNDPPIANDQSATAQEDTPLPITVTASDPDGDLLTYSILTGPSNGTITGFDPATGQLTYTPDSDYNGPDSFNFEACDPSGL